MVRITPIHKASILGRLEGVPQPDPWDLQMVINHVMYPCPGMILQVPVISGVMTKLYEGPKIHGKAWGQKTPLNRGYKYLDVPGS